MAPIVGAKVSWTTARFVQEALDLGLHVVEDAPMVKLIGRTKFIDLVVRGTVGWHEGVRTFRFSNQLAFFYKLAYLVSLVLLFSIYARYLFIIILMIFLYRFVIITVVRRTTHL
jgi:hypothetical protein